MVPIAKATAEARIIPSEKVDKVPTLSRQIESIIKKSFPLINLSIYEEAETGDIVFSIDSKEIYYDDEFLSLITKINKI